MTRPPCIHKKSCCEVTLILNIFDAVFLVSVSCHVLSFRFGSSSELGYDVHWTSSRANGFIGIVIQIGIVPMILLSSFSEYCILAQPGQT